MEIHNILFEQKPMKRFRADLERKFGESVDYRKLENWIKTLDLILEFAPKFSAESNDYNYLINKLHTKDDAVNFINKYFSLTFSSISAAIIARDEERCIERCITSILPVFDEIIIVDTGSTDKTLDIIEHIQTPKIKMFNIKWENDFAKARNFALEKVTSKWVFFIDADEYYLPSAKDELRSILALLSSLHNINSTVLCPLIRDINENSAIGIKRIFKTDTDIKYYGVVHEEARIWKNNSWETTQSISVNITLMHDGYTYNIRSQKNKHERNMTLNKLMLDKEPGNLRWIFFYVRDAQGLLPYEELESLITNAILINLQEGIEVKNLKTSDYTFGILDEWAKLALRELVIEKLNKITDCMEALYPGYSNTIYYKTFAEMLILKSKNRKLLFDLIEYRKHNDSVQYGSIHSEHAHIDFLIGNFLFESGNFEKAFSYFELVKDQFMPSEYVDYYNNLAVVCTKWQKAVSNP